jgi:GTP-binding protein HflX
LPEDARAATATQAARQDDVIAISAISGQGLSELIAAIGDKLSDATHLTQLHLRFAEGRKRAWLFEKELVEAETQTEDGFDLTVRWTARQEKRFRAL